MKFLFVLIVIILFAIVSILAETIFKDKSYMTTIVYNVGFLGGNVVAIIILI